MKNKRIVKPGYLYRGRTVHRAGAGFNAGLLAKIIDINVYMMYDRCMIRTQIQLPDPLYKDLKRIAAQNDWPLAEVLRRGGELMVARFPDRPREKWKMPGPYDCGGDFLTDPAFYNPEADALEEKMKRL